ncbi:GNAT family N-acetyltransferase [Marinococcus luteus]|uniref:GNAT family N-acetyltransferase n=1 Tax=Marinococcus luteus TaxID=1122204 RepID=UPI002ACC7AF4|nr:GNAT family N-acetyltransferase [Marinococcus luteus]MDZ5783875.1 GNAT family N-acetyltransferase [Marinococcus luteus]
MHIRRVQTKDYYMVKQVINEWWDGRDMAGKLPKFLFDHFQETSFIAEMNDRMTGFLVGFLSQTREKEAYIHFAGVHPHNRGEGIAEGLYEAFFECALDEDRRLVRAVTSPDNEASVAFHKAMGFNLVTGDKTENGLPVHTDYDGEEQDRILFEKQL